MRDHFKKRRVSPRSCCHHEALEDSVLPQPTRVPAPARSAQPGGRQSTAQRRSRGSRRWSREGRAEAFQTAPEGGFVSRNPDLWPFMMSSRLSSGLALSPPLTRKPPQSRQEQQRSGKIATISLVRGGNKRTVCVLASCVF
ncbi:hypothetical protein GN956_G5229 [Arapaima gigas]